MEQNERKSVRLGKRLLGLVLAFALLATTVLIGGINAGAASSPLDSMVSVAGPTITFTAPEAAWLNIPDPSTGTSDTIENYAQISSSGALGAGSVVFTSTATITSCTITNDWISGSYGAGTSALPTGTGSLNTGLSRPHNTSVLSEWKAEFTLQGSTQTYTAYAYTVIWCPSLLMAATIGNVSTFAASIVNRYSNSSTLAVLGLHNVASANGYPKDNFRSNWLGGVMSPLPTNEWGDVWYSSGTSNTINPVPSVAVSSSHPGTGAASTTTYNTSANNYITVDISRFNNMNLMATMRAALGITCDERSRTNDGRWCVNPGHATWNTTGSFGYQDGSAGVETEGIKWHVAHGTNFALGSVGAKTVALSAHYRNGVSGSDQETNHQLDYTVNAVNKNTYLRPAVRSAYTNRYPNEWLSNNTGATGFTESLKTQATRLGDPKDSNYGAGYDYAGAAVTQQERTKVKARVNCYKYENGTTTDKMSVLDTASHSWDGTAFDEIEIEIGDGITVTAPKFAGWTLRLIATHDRILTSSGTGFTETLGCVDVSNARWDFYYEQDMEYTINYNGNGNTSGTAPGVQTPLNKDSSDVLHNQNSLVKDNAVFQGWNTKADGLGTFFAAGTPVSALIKDYPSIWSGTGSTRGTTLYAMWTDNARQRVEYYPNVPAAAIDPVTPALPYILSTQDYVPGNAITLIANPYTLPGYAFNGWITDDTDPGSDFTDGDPFPTGVTGNYKLYANWTKVLHNITFDYNDGVTSPTTPASLGYGDAIAEPSTNPTRPGYTFKGWADGAALVFPGIPGALPDLGTTPRTVIYVAQWEANQHDIWYYPNNPGAVPSAPVRSVGSYAAGDPVTLATGLFTCTGYNFLGWSASAGAAAPDTAITSFPATDADVKLYAVWGKVLHNITFDFDDGSTSDITLTGLGYGDPITGGPTANPTRTGYTFKGWADGAVIVFPGVPATLPDLGLTPQNITYKAQWEADGHYIRYYPNDPGSVDGVVPSTDIRSADPYKAGDPVTLEGAIFACAGYGFLGWSANPGAAAPDTAITVFPATDTDIALYAVWQKALHNITFDFDDGSTADITLTGLAYGDALTGAPGAAPTREGYTFKGWSDGVSAPFLTVPATLPNLGTTAQNVTYKAQWEADGHYIWYYPNYPAGIPAGTETRSLDPYKANDPVTLQGQIFTCTGYKFLGWSSNPGAAAPDSPALSAFPATDADVKLYAVWEHVQHSLTFEMNYPGATPVNYQFSGTTGYYGTAISTPVPAPAYTGYTFKGWYTAATGGALVWTATPATVPFTDDTPQNTTVYAQWDVQAYVVTWNYGHQAEGIDVTQSSTVVFDSTLGAAATVSYPGDVGDAVVPLRDGWVFAGWYTGPGGTGTPVTKATPVDFTAPQTYYAHWTQRNFEVLLVQQPGTTGIPTAPVSLGAAFNAGDVVTITLPPYGSPFQGFWRIMPSGTGVSPAPSSDGTQWLYTVQTPSDSGNVITLTAIYEDNPVEMIFNPAGGMFGVADGPHEPDEPKDYMTAIGETVDFSNDLIFGAFRVSRHGYTFTGWDIVSGDGRFDSIPGVYDQTEGDNTSSYKAGSFDTVLEAQWEIDKDIEPFDPLLPPFDGYDPEDPGSYNPPPPPSGDPDGPGGWPETGDGDPDEPLWPPHDEEGDPIPWPPEDVTIPEYGGIYENLPALGCFEEWHFLGYYEPTGRRVENGMTSQLAAGEVLSVMFARKFAVHYDAAGGTTDRGEAVSHSTGVVYGHALNFVCSVIPKGQPNDFKTTHANYFPAPAEKANSVFLGWFNAPANGTPVNGSETVGNIAGAALLLRDDPLYSGAQIALEALTNGSPIVTGGTYYAQWEHKRTWWDDVTEWFNDRQGTTGYNIPGWIYTCDLPGCLKAGLSIGLPFLSFFGVKIDKISGWSRGCLGFLGFISLFFVPITLLFSCIYPVIRPIAPGWWPEWQWHQFSLWLWY